MAEFSSGDIVDVDLGYTRIRGVRVAEVSNMLDASGIPTRAVHGTEEAARDVLRNAAMYKVEVRFGNEIYGEHEQADGQTQPIGGNYVGEIWVPEAHVEPLEDESFKQAWNSPLP